PRVKHSGTLGPRTAVLSCPVGPRRVTPDSSAKFLTIFPILIRLAIQVSAMTARVEQDRQISEVIAEEGSRLRSFIRRRVPNEADVEDLLQEVFSELVEATRRLKPSDH